MTRPIYLDHHATTPTDPRVMEAMRPYFEEEYGNASSATHAFGWRAQAALEDARERLAAAIGAADPSEIIFTSGTTESDNLALKGVMRAGRRRGDHLVTTAIEHPAVLDSCRALEKEGFSIAVLPVDGEGLVDPERLARALSDQSVLVSVMAANSEIGVLQPLEEIARLCGERGVLLHSDAAQAIGKIPLDVEEVGVDLLSMCAHKLYGPKGVGALYLRKRRPRIPLEPLFHGGGHERGLRPGTLPVALCVGFATAVELCLEEREAEAERLTGLRELLWSRLRDGLDDLTLNGHPTQRLPGNLNCCFGGVEADGLIASLPELAISSGSACSSARPEPSHVLRALGRSDAEARSALRFGLGRGNTRQEIERAAECLIHAVREQRQKRAGGQAPSRGGLSDQ